MPKQFWLNILDPSRQKGSRGVAQLISSNPDDVPPSLLREPGTYSIVEKDEEGNVRPLCYFEVAKPKSVDNALDGLLAGAMPPTAPLSNSLHTAKELIEFGLNLARNSQSSPTSNTTPEPPDKFTEIVLIPLAVRIGDVVASWFQRWLEGLSSEDAKLLGLSLVDNAVQAKETEDILPDGSQ